MTQDFDFDTLPPSSKASYRVTLPMDETPEQLDALVEAIVLASGESTSPDAIRATLDESLHDGALSLPVLAARGREPGECLAVTAGVHGDEYEGMLAIQQVFDELDPARMRGCFIAVPVVTLPAFWLGVRANPFDGRNMARVFPGSHDGTLSERMAATLLERVLRHASLYIDLHSAGSKYHMLTLCGYIADGAQAERAKRAAEIFGAPFIWEHPAVGPGRTLTSTLELGIPSLYAETHGGGGARDGDVRVYIRGVSNLLHHMKIASLSRASTGETSRARRLRGSGDLDVSITCSASGLYFAEAEVGDKVHRGDLMGLVRSLDGGVVDRVVAPDDGIVVLTRAVPRVYAGEAVAAITGELEGDDE